MVRSALVFLLVASAFVAFARAQYRRPINSGGNPTIITGAYGEPAATMHGVLKQLTNKDIYIVAEGDQTVKIERTHKTKFLRDGKPIKASEIALGSVLSIDVGKDPQLKPQAINVMVDSPPIDDAKPAPASNN
jgi:hypothetical protein